jgi:hypothetical protein
MAVTRRELRPVPPNEGGPVGTMTYDDETGELELTGLAAQVTRRERQQVGDDRTYGALLVERGWSNGQLYLAPATESP